MPKSILLGEDKRQILVLDRISHVERLLGDGLIRVTADGKPYHISGKQSRQVLDYLGYELDDRESSRHGFKPLQSDGLDADAQANSQIDGS